MRDRRTSDEHTGLELSRIGGSSRIDNSAPHGDA